MYVEAQNTMMPFPVHTLLNTHKHRISKTNATHK